MVKTGLSAVIGSWKISARFHPHAQSCISRSERAPAGSRPLVDEPSLVDPSGRFHEPHDRERRQRLAAPRLGRPAPSVSPGATEKLTSMTAGTKRPPISKPVVKLLDREQRGSVRHRSRCARPNTARSASAISPTVAPGFHRLGLITGTRFVRPARRRWRPRRVPVASRRRRATPRTARTRSICRGSISGSMRSISILCVFRRPEPVHARRRRCRPASIASWAR